MARALVLIDIQSGFVNQHTSPALPYIERRVEQAVASGEYDRITATQFINPDRSWEVSHYNPFRDLLDWHEMSAEDSEDIAVLPFVEHHCYRVSEKRKYTADLAELHQNRREGAPPFTAVGNRG